MKRKLNEPLSLNSAISIITFSVLLILVSATIARACTPALAIGCDINCTVQIINDCSDPVHNHCVLRTCDDCSNCSFGCHKDCSTFSPCGGCVSRMLDGCTALIECCSDS